MPTYEKCSQEIYAIMHELMVAAPTHKPLLDARVKVDLLFAYADVDDRGMVRGYAIVRRGMRCLGLARRIGLKDRVLGRGDAEIMLDGDWWKETDAAKCRAVLDHELCHLTPKTDKRGFLRDDIGRPLIELRPHDFEFGWFTEIVERHGEHAIERVQARTIFDAAGQLYWPDLGVKS